MIRLALFGAGRIGLEHARNIVGNRRVKLRHVIEPVDSHASSVTMITGARRSSADEAIADDLVDGYILASPTNTHAGLLERLSTAGRPILCEKPISLDFDEALHCARLLKEANARCIIGFHRRFDPSFAEVKARIASGDVGEVFQVVISSRSWGPPPDSYIRTSGGLFRDQSIHDFDMARYLLGVDMEKVFAVGDALVEERIRALADIDTALITLVATSGTLVQINNGRFAAHGYDQRLEVFGTKASLFVGNVPGNSLLLGTSSGTVAAPPQATFVERYRDAYARELDAFLDMIEGRASPAATYLDGLEAHRLSEAATQSRASGSVVTVQR